MKDNADAQNMGIGLWSALVSSAYLILADYLLNHFSAFWLLFTSLMILPFFVPVAWRNKSKYLSWTKTAWFAFALVGILSGAYNLAFLLSADKLPISVASMFLSIASVMVLPLTCLMSSRFPQLLELASIVMVLIGVILVLQLHEAKYSLLGIILGLLTTFLTANATIYSSKSRNLLVASEAMISKQLGKLVFAVIGLTFFIKEDLEPNDSAAYLWLILGLYGLIKIYDTFVASRAQFLLPPLIFQNLSLLSLPVVCIAELILFNGTFSIWQWMGVIAIILAGFLASRSKQIKINPIQ
ncbi:EamA family transporter [Synechococcus sp. AH-707-D15]|nr:EamA family transporter [Synechococcus sp. AH-707-D15]